MDRCDDDTFDGRAALIRCSPLETLEDGRSGTIADRSRFSPQIRWRRSAPQRSTDGISVKPSPIRRACASDRTDPADERDRSPIISRSDARGAPSSYRLGEPIRRPIVRQRSVYDDGADGRGVDAPDGASDTGESRARASPRHDAIRRRIGGGTRRRASRHHLPAKTRVRTRAVSRTPAGTTSNEGTSVDDAGGRSRASDRRSVRSRGFGLRRRRSSTTDPSTDLER